MTRKHKGPILSVRAFIENIDGQILVLKRAKTENAPGHWSLPGGILPEYSESPEEGLTKLVLAKTGLMIRDLDFLSHQNSPPSPAGSLYCINAYFKAKTDGAVRFNNDFSEYAWVNPKNLHDYNLAFKGDAAIKFYEDSKIPGEDLLWMLVNEAGSHSIPVTRERLIELQSLPGSFTQLHEDLEVYELVRTKVHATLDMIRHSSRRDDDSIIEHVESRTKRPDSILEKRVRKRDKDGIPRLHTTFDDNAGGRAIVSFLKDVYTVRDKILQFPEYKLYAEENHIETPMDTGYRGLHLILEVPLPNINFIPHCEVQIRTVIQHAWATAAHNLTYKKPADKIPANVLQELRAQSELAFELDNGLNRTRHDVEHYFSNYENTK